MIDALVPMDRRHDNFRERFMEQRIQNINHSKQPSMEHSLAFLIEPLRTAPVTLPQKRVNNFSSDSGVNSLHVLSPAVPKTPNTSQPHLIPSTSRHNPPTRPLTTSQQIISNNRKSKTKEPKYNRSLANHPDSQSVLRTRTRQGYKLYIPDFCMPFYDFPFSYTQQLSAKLSAFFIPDNNA